MKPINSTKSKQAKMAILMAFFLAAKKEEKNHWVFAG